VKKRSIRIAGQLFSFSESQLEPGWTVSKRPGDWLIFTTAAGDRIRLMKTSSRSKVFASVGGLLISGEIQQEGVKTVEALTGADADLTAQFPGKVRKILVLQDQVVAQGEPLILVEAMKMEFTIKAPFPGQISKICVSEGQQLAPGDRFVEMTDAVAGAPSGT